MGTVPQLGSTAVPRAGEWTVCPLGELGSFPRPRQQLHGARLSHDCAVVFTGKFAVVRRAVQAAKLTENKRCWFSTVSTQQGCSDLSPNPHSWTSLGSGWPQETSASLLEGSRARCQPLKASMGARRGSARPGHRLLALRVGSGSRWAHSSCRVSSESRPGAAALWDCCSPASPGLEEMRDASGFESVVPLAQSSSSLSFQRPVLPDRCQPATGLRHGAHWHRSPPQ